jgi:hypothetical protein
MIFDVRFRRVCQALALSATCLLPMQSASAHGDWSAEAISLVYLRRAEIVSPDGRRAVIISEGPLVIEMDGRPLQGTENRAVTTLAELAWAPDSGALFITQSYGGAVGEWRVAVYTVESGGVRAWDVSSEVVRQFRKLYKCKGAEAPNVGAAKWLDGSKRLLLVAEIPPHSSCPEMGKVRGYVVEIPDGRIVESFGARELKARWAQYLGKRFGSK